MTDKQMPDVIKFLLGEGQFEGFGFGEFPDNGEIIKRRYWWRKALHEAWNTRTDLAPSTTDEQKALDARVAALEKHSHVPVDFTPYIRRIEALEISIASPPCVDVEGLKRKAIKELSEKSLGVIISEVARDIFIAVVIDYLESRNLLRTSDAGGGVRPSVKKTTEDYIRELYALITDPSTPTDAGVEQSCQYCGGQGYTVRTEPDCCGDFMETGECKSYCCVPKEVQEQCSGCYGSGKAPTPPTDEQRALDALNRIKRRLCRRLKLEEYDSTDFIIVEQFLTRDQRSDDG